MRFIHVADVHLDAPFGARAPGVRRRLRKAAREAFREAVSLAIREDTHAFVVAGDLFDGDHLSFATERFLLEELRRLEAHGIQVVYATGNHDPSRAAAGQRSLAWPTNVHVSDSATPTRVRIDAPDGTPLGYVTAIGHETERETRDLSRLLPRPEGELPEVAVLHTQVRASPGADAHEPYAPSELGYLTRAGYDYWALGHVHRPMVLAEDPPVVYAGSLVPRSRGEVGPRGVYLVDISAQHHAALSFRPLSPVRWEVLEVDHLDDASTLDRLETLVEHAWSRRRSEIQDARAGTEWLLRVELRGPCPLWRELRMDENREALESALQARLGVLDAVLSTEGVLPAVPVAELRARPDPLGEALRLLEEVRADPTLLELPAAVELQGEDHPEEGTPDAYLRRLLEDAEAELAARFLGEGRRRS